MRTADMRVGDWVEMTNDGGCFHGTATRYGRVVEMRNGDALVRFGRMMSIRFYAYENAIDVRKLDGDEIAALGLK